MSDCEYEIDGDDFIVQDQEIVISNVSNVGEEEEMDDDEDDDEDDDDDENDDDSNSSDDSDSSSASSSSDSGDGGAGSGGEGGDDSEEASSDNEQAGVQNPTVNDNRPIVQAQVADEDADEDDEEGGDDCGSSEKQDNQTQNNDNREEEDDDDDNDDDECEEEENHNGQVEKHMLDENGVYKWSEFVGAKIKSFSCEEYRSYQKPFGSGWKRELVLRCTGSTSEKKAGDVYYHTPDGGTKLRSYVEMNQYIKRHPNCQLTVENFTFAKQPIYRPPDEIVRHAMQRGANFVERPFFFNKHIRSNQHQSESSKSSARDNMSQKQTQQQNQHFRAQISKNDTMNDDSNDHNEIRSSHGPNILGRGKRKRVLPSRYDDNDFDYIPVKKGKSLRDSLSNGNSQDSNSPQSSNKSNGSTSKMSAQERRRTLQQQLYQQIHEEQIKKEKLEEKQQQLLSGMSTSTSTLLSALNNNHNHQGTKEMSQKHSAYNTVGHQSNMVSPLKMKISKNGTNFTKKSSLAKEDKAGVGEPLSCATEGENDSSQLDDVCDRVDSLEGKNFSPIDETAADEGANTSTLRQPCSAHCPGRRNMLPNLMCSRCFCLFHLDCVPDGVFLKEPTVFICPNCLTPEDKDRIENKSHNNKKNGLGNGSNPISAPSGINSGGNLMKTNSKRKLTDQMETFVGDKHATSSLLDYSSANNQIPTLNPIVASTATKTSSSLLKSGGGIDFQFTNGSTNGYKTLNEKRLGKRIGMYSRKDLNGFASMSKMTPTASGSRSNGFGSINKKKQMGQYFNTKTPLQFQPGINHVYRVAQASNGHSVVLKDRTMPYGGGMANSMSPNMMSGSGSSNANCLSLMKNTAKLLQDKQTLANAAQQLARHQYYSTLSTNNSTSKLLDDKFQSIMSMTNGPASQMDLFNSVPTAQHSINYNSKYYKYLQKHHNVLNVFHNNVSPLIKIFEYLDTKDIINLRQSSRFWYQLTSIPVVWRRLRLRGLTVFDWAHLGQRLIDQYQSTVLDLAGVRVPANSPIADSTNSTTPNSRNEKIVNFWQNFSSLHLNLNTVRVLKFGTVPLFVLRNLAEFVSLNDQKLSSLCSLSITNLFDDKSQDTESPSSQSFVSHCKLGFLAFMKPFANLSSLRIDSAGGFVLGEEPSTQRQEQFQKIVDTLTHFKQLSSFICTSFKDLTNDEIGTILSSFDSTKMSHLELGSCRNWFQNLSKDINSATTTTTTLFDQLSKFSNLLSLRFCDLTIQANSSPIVSIFESLIVVERLTIDNLQIDNTGYSVWQALTAMFKSLPLIELHLSTSDPFTNRELFESFRELVTTQKRLVHVRWRVTVNIDDYGHCYVPLALQHQFKEYNFVQRYFGSNQNGAQQKTKQNTGVDNADLYQIIDSNDDGGDGGSKLILVEISTLTDLLNRDVNLNSYASNEPKVSIQIVPQ